MVDIAKVLMDPKSKIVISVILGLGLAAAFKKTCVGNNCILIKGPKSSDVEGHVYRLRDSCYRYTPRVVECADKSKTLDT